MKHTLLADILVFTIAVSMLEGCNKKKIDYSFDGDTEMRLEHTEESTGINDASLEQFCNETIWKDNWAVTDKYDEKRSIRIDAPVIVPELEAMHVIEITPLCKEEFKKQCLDNFFRADTEYYYHEEENYTKEELEKWLPDETEMIENASETRMVTEEFESVTHYAAYRDGLLYEIYMTDAQVSIWPNQEEIVNCGPERFRNCEQVSIDDYMIESEENECKYSLEEAQKIADDYMKNIGLSAMDCDFSAQLKWTGNDSNIDDESADEYVCYGYVFEYSTGLDGISFAQFPKPNMFQTQYITGSKPEDNIVICGADITHSQTLGPYGAGKVSIYVTDFGIYSVLINNPEVIGTISNSVGLLPLNTVKTIYEKEIAERTAKYDIRDFIAYNYFELIYLKVSGETQETVSAVPVWCLSWKDGNTRNHPVFVNAIDGTMVHYADAEWAGIELPEE